MKFISFLIDISKNEIFLNLEINSFPSSKETFLSSSKSILFPTTIGNSSTELKSKIFSISFWTFSNVFLFETS